ncbi:MAG: EAL domain-containing protein, partial [Pseudomonadota bacterium]|nr:EAL domain-containing protein [Pseudomonadota bacterium]
PQRGVVSPADFIPRAEENGLIVPLGEWVLRAACRDLVHWLKLDARLRMAVNLSPRQFRNPALVDMVRGILAETGVPPTSLELEVTEGTLMDSDDATLQILHALRAMGLSIALDDFGTGYSSMSYLKRLPLTHLKVDRSFINGLPDSKDSLAIVRAILSMARNLGFTVTAEGVESAAQGLVLIELECDMLQGYYFSEPVPAEDVPPLLHRRWNADLMLRVPAPRDRATYIAAT